MTRSESAKEARPWTVTVLPRRVLNLVSYSHLYTLVDGHTVGGADHNL